MQKRKATSAWRKPSGKRQCSSSAWPSPSTARSRASRRVRLRPATIPVPSCRLHGRAPAARCAPRARRRPRRDEFHARPRPRRARAPDRLQCRRTTLVPSLVGRGAAGRTGCLDVRHPLHQRQRRLRSSASRRRDKHQDRRHRDARPAGRRDPDPLRQAPRPERRIAAWRILAGEFDPKAIDGAIVLIGATASALYDLRATPLENAVPGIDIHAEMIESVLAGAHLTRPDFMRGLETVLVADRRSLWPRRRRAAAAACPARS